ncbi:hypothetical protein Ahy_B03g062138 isoform A [Arachis hypogaea]|uniref:Uncharacterized protein n=1 Tax=Arachis hypogaea TaxID=3818 RepID=A0A444ZT54_ARAHY|nr:hypothetical protein Ahy_B03g062138 isoform A [Arachis hypogaea]
MPENCHVVGITFSRLYSVGEKVRSASVPAFVQGFWDGTPPVPWPDNFGNENVWIMSTQPIVVEVPICNAPTPASSVAFLAWHDDSHLQSHRNDGVNSSLNHDSFQSGISTDGAKHSCLERVYELERWRLEIPTLSSAERGREDNLQNTLMLKSVE